MTSKTYVSRRIVLTCLAALGLSGVAGILNAQDAGFAKRPVRIIVPFPPGGGVDLVARLVGNGITPQIGQQVIVENRSGAGGNIGAAAVAKAPPDGHTLLVAPTGVLALAPVLFKDAGYSPSKDLVPVAVLVTLPQVLMVPASSPHKSFNELMAFARANPGKLTVGSSGKGSGQHLAVELLMKLGGLKFHHVPYRGSADVTRAVVAGETDMAFVDPASLALARSGKLRALAVTTEKRVSALPDTPTIGEAVRGYEAASHFALLAPAGTPADVVAQINAAVAKTLGEPGLRSRLENEGMTPSTESAAYAAQFVRGQSDKWQKFIAESGIELR